MLQNATPLRKSAPGPPNSSDEHVSCTAPATENASLKILFKCPTPAIVSGNAAKPSRFAHFLTRCTIPCACHAKRHLNLQKWREHVVFCTFSLRNVLRATTACTFSTSQLPKVVRGWGILYILTWKCASRHNGVHFFDISTSKSGPRLRWIVHFDFEMCFAPQRRALFRQRNFQKWSEPGVFCTFWLRNVLRATTACTFSTSQLPKVVRGWGVLYILTSKCASRHNGVHFFDISTSKSGPTLRCFVHFDFEMCFAPQRRALFRHLNFQKWSEAEVFCTFWLRHVFRATTACNFSSLIWPAGSAPAALASLLFDPPEPQIIGKHTVFRDFPTFSRICIFFLLTLSLLLFSLLIFLFSLPLPCSAFHLSMLSEVWLLNFLRSYPILYVYCCALHEWSRIFSFLSKLCQLGRLVSQWLIFWRCWGNGRERAMWSPGVNPLGPKPKPTTVICRKRNSTARNSNWFQSKSFNYIQEQWA